MSKGNTYLSDPTKAIVDALDQYSCLAGKCPWLAIIDTKLDREIQEYFSKSAYIFPSNDSVSLTPYRVTKLACHATGDMVDVKLTTNPALLKGAHFQLLDDLLNVAEIPYGNANKN